MTIDGEPAKALLPYLQRADELQKHDHLAAYYCRLYAMEKGLKIPPKERTSETKAILISLMNQLEKDKRVVKLSADDNMYMEGFALRVFTKADKQDRAGRADLKTAMTFYAASIFFEVLLQFGELPPDILEKQKYASWKAVDIRKALAEGRKPVPGPPAAEKDVPDLEEEESNLSPETPQQRPMMSPPRDSSFRPTTLDSTPSHNNLTQPAPPSEPFYQHSYSKSSEDFNLPSAPSNPIPPSYNQSSYQQPTYPRTSDSLGGTNPPGPTIGTFSYPQDPPGYNAYPQDPAQFHQPDPAQYPGQYHQQDPAQYHQQDPAQYHQQDPAQYHQQQSSHWPNSASPFSDPSSAYPSVFPSGGYQAPQYPSHGATTPSLARTTSAPVAPPESKPASTGYQLNGSYDSEYKPSAGTIAEAHKSSRFAVSALAFDDVPTAIEYLRKSLELLTSPSASVD